MTRFSANLGFLFQELSLPDAIRAAGAAGFDAVECHWPYVVDAAAVQAALAASGLSMLGLNTARGDVAAGDNGLAALPGREREAQAAIDQALDYASRIGASHVHVMAGKASGPAAQGTFVRNLSEAAAKAAPLGLTLVIEPLNHFDAPGYFLSHTSHAEAVIAEVAAPNLKLMFDCYHVQIMEGDLSRSLSRLMPIIGHIQIAAVPDRGEPGQGEVDYRHICGLLHELGYTRPIGAEYKPRSSTLAGLGWLKELRHSAKT
ncbi:MAG: TIM barrel protein [Hyphomicrobiales bacterium]